MLFVLTEFAITNLLALDRRLTFAKPVDYVKISQDFLYAAKTGDTTKGYIDTLKNANEEMLAS